MLRFTLAALLLAAGAVHAQPAPAVLSPNENLVAEGIPPIPAALAEEVRRYTEARSARFLDWHPVRHEMLVSTRFAETPQVHLVRAPLGARTQLTFFNERVGAALWQPTRGDFFIFSKDVGGGEWYQYYRQDMADGRVTLLTDGASRNTGATWSQDGERIAYHSTRRNRKDADLYVMDPRDPRSDKLVLQLEGGGWEVQDWSRDGMQLVLQEFISINESYLWLADLKTGTKKLVTPKGGAKVAYGGARFTVDGRGLWVTTDRDFEFQRLARLDLATGRYDYLSTHVPWDIADFDVSEDGRSIAYTSNEAGNFVVRLRDVASGRERTVEGLPPGILGRPKFHKDGCELAVQSYNPRTPGDAWSVDLATNRARPWTESELGGLNRDAIQVPKLVKWKSFDGLEISGWLTQPPAKFTGKRPVIIDIHGGPEGQSLPSYKGRRNYFVNELGVAVIDPNVRGSTGFGKTFVALDNGMLRENTYKDIGALLDWIAQQPDLDASRVMVTGGSYGGHMTWALSYLYSDRLRAALPVVGMSNLVTFLENTESYRRDLRRVEYGDERDPKMREFLQRIAPMTHAAKIRHPVFVVQGKNDPRVPWSESDQMVRTIRANGAPVWFLTANNEGHGFGKKPNQDFQFYATVMFIREYLLK
ncbi:prolyl oligopeptidase family serine peptidase [Ramlibacter sp. XY19]|uniref:S9 family peptidase n=1 Tax=Ramlibacter paludis TaxID=2908000 RepID=UPI0023DC00C5|nr:prolyl oligopeptidase family serine peptidase [Ramlibacter paludis]MCG2591697.1 prolyl oligopeptidase family serine peptidase [Ramlibacter paludis]